MRKKVEKDNRPKSLLDKWLHYDRSFTTKQICSVLEMGGREYYQLLMNPARYVTVAMTEKLAYLLDKPPVEVYLCCLKKPIKEVMHDEKKLKLMMALERAGIK